MLSVIGKHLDALYLSVYVEFPEKLQDLFRALKTDCQQSGDDMAEFLPVPGVPGGPLYIRPYGRGKYQFVVENASIYVALSTWQNMPTIDIQFKSATLYEYEPDQLPVIVDRFVSYFFEGDYEVKVSRVDLAVDFQEEGFELPDMRDVVTRARSRTVNYRGNTPNAMTLGERKGAVQAQIYCKSLELEQSEKDWMLQVWKASGLYRESLAVWRTEVRFYREGLRAFDLNTMSEVLGGLRDLADYAVGENAGSWLRVAERESRGENTSRRRPTAWWSEVRNSLCAAFDGTGRKRKGYNPRPSYRRSIELAGAHMARAAALARLGVE